MPITTLSFEPLQPVRPDALGERIYLRQYQRLVGGRKLNIFHFSDEPRPDDFRDLGTYRTQSLDAWWPGTSFYSTMARTGSFPENLSLTEAWQRRASVASSFVKWLGTNEGQRLLGEAAQLQKILETTDIRPTLGTYRADTLAMALARRVSQTDGQIRTTILAESHGRDHAGFMAVDKANCSYDDTRVLEEMACWLGTPIGQEYLTGCRKTLDRKLTDERRKRYAADNIKRMTQGLPPQPSISQVVARMKQRLKHKQAAPTRQPT